jgi:hypothetical protein
VITNINLIALVIMFGSVAVPVIVAAIAAPTVARMQRPRQPYDLRAPTQSGSVARGRSMPRLRNTSFPGLDDPSLVLAPAKKSLTSMRF